MCMLSAFSAPIHSASREKDEAIEREVQKGWAQMEACVGKAESLVAQQPAFQLLEHRWSAQLPPMAGAPARPHHAPPRHDGEGDALPRWRATYALRQRVAELEAALQRGAADLAERKKLEERLGHYAAALRALVEDVGALRREAQQRCLLPLLPMDFNPDDYPRYNDLCREFSFQCIEHVSRLIHPWRDRMPLVV